MEYRGKKGFTLIEIIIVVAIIALLAAALYVAIDPAKRLGDTKDARRYADVTAILNAILQYTVDATTLPTQVDCAIGTYCMIENGATVADEFSEADCGEVNQNNGVALTGMALGISLVDKYLSTIPSDPGLSSNSTSTSKYYLKRSLNGRITVGACDHYQTASVEVQR